MHQHGVRSIGRPNHHFQNGLQRRPDLKPDVGKLFVRHLSAQTNEDSLYRAFATNGLKVKKTKILVDEQTGLSKRCGFVTLYDRGQVTMAINKFNNAAVDGSVVIVVEAEPNKLPPPKQSPHFNQQNRTSSFPRPSISVGSKYKSPFSSTTHPQGCNASQRRAPVVYTKKSVPPQSFKTANTRDYFGPPQSACRSSRETSAYSPAQQQSAPLHSYASNRGYQEQRQPGRDGGAAMPSLERRGGPHLSQSQNKPARYQLPLNSVRLVATSAPWEHSSGSTDESSLSSLQEETNRSVDSTAGTAASAYRASTAGMVNQYSTSKYREQYRSDRAAAALWWDQQEDSHKRRRADGNWTSAGEYEPY